MGGTIRPKYAVRETAMGRADAMDMIKAIILGCILTGVVAVVVGVQGSSGGALAVHSMAVGDHRIYWSWPLFVLGSALSWGIMWLQR